VSVIDTGSGISPENMGRLFEKNRFSPPSPNGLGMGLNICRSIVEGQGGRLTAGAQMRIEECGFASQFPQPMDDCHEECRNGSNHR